MSPQHVIGPGINLGVMDAVLAGHEQAADAVAAHIPEGHGARRWIIPGHYRRNNVQARREGRAGEGNVVKPLQESAAKSELPKLPKMVPKPLKTQK